MSRGDDTHVFTERGAMSNHFGSAHVSVSEISMCLISTAFHHVRVVIQMRKCCEFPRLYKQVWGLLQVIFFCQISFYSIHWNDDWFFRLTSSSWLLCLLWSHYCLVNVDLVILSVLTSWRLSLSCWESQGYLHVSICNKSRQQGISWIKKHFEITAHIEFQKKVFFLQ